MRIRLAASLVAVLSLAGCASAAPPAAPVAGPSVVTTPQTQLVLPDYRVSVNRPDGNAGFIFLTPGTSPAADVLGAASKPAVPTVPAPEGLEIVDRAGRAVWFNPLPARQSAGNLQVQTYQGRPVLTWWQGTQDPKSVGHGAGVDYLADSHYRVITSFTPGGGLSADVHELRLTPDGHALVTSYHAIPYDLTPFGGPKNGQLLDCVASVIDVATKKTLFQWSALQRVPVTDSYLTASSSGQQAKFDPFHMNSIALAPNGDLIISMRHTSTVYDINPVTGAINWQLGGKHSSFAAGPGVQFSFQHDAEFLDPTTVRLFDNDSNGTTTNGVTSVETIRLDIAKHTANLLGNQPRPDKVTAAAMGNAQSLPGGNTFSGWGQSGRIAEFSASGQLIYDAVTPQGASYRAYLQPWVGQPDQAPQLTLSNTGTPTLHAIWNGATSVVNWRVLHGTSASTLTPIVTAGWNGLNTAIPLPAGTPPTGYFELEALDAHGGVVGHSSPTAATAP